MSHLIAWFYRFKKRHPYLTMSVLVYALVPVVVGLALGYEMHDDSPVHIPTVVVNGDKSQFSYDFINYVDQTAYFDVSLWAETSEQAERLIQEGQALAGMIIPADFYKDLLAGKSPDILLLYDGSQLGQLLLRFQRHIRHPGKTANTADFRKSPRNHSGNLQQTFRFQHKRISAC